MRQSSSDTLNEPRIVTGPWNGHQYVCDTYCRHLCSIPLANNGVLSASQEESLRESNSRPPNPSGTAEILVHTRALGARDLRNNVARVVSSLGKEVKTTCSILFDRFCPSEFDDTISLVNEFRKLSLGTRTAVRFNLKGHFSSVDAVVLEELFSAGLCLDHAEGFWRSCPKADSSRLEYDVVRMFSEFGHAMTVTWFVHKHNLKEMPTLLSQSLQANHSAGCSVQPVFTHPAYSVTDSADFPCPSPEEYLETAVLAYSLHSAVDQVFYSGAELVGAIQNGGWDAKYRCPSNVKVLIESTGAKFFRQIPAAAVEAGDVSSLIDRPGCSAWESLQQLHAEKLQMPADHYCTDCQWKHVCGGTDDNISDALATTTQWQDVLCSYRMTFLDFFCHARQSNIACVPSAQH